MVDVKIKLLSGKTITMPVEADATVLQLKEVCMQREGIPVEQIRFIFNGKTIKDEDKLADAGVNAGATLHMMLNIRGGRQ